MALFDTRTSSSASMNRRGISILFIYFLANACSFNPNTSHLGCEEANLLGVFNVFAPLNHVVVVTRSVWSVYDFVGIDQCNQLQGSLHAVKGFVVKSEVRCD